MTIPEIKQTARAKLKGCYIKCCSSSLLFFIFVLILTCLETLIINLALPEILKIMIELLFGIISLILSYGLIANIIELSDNKTSSITNFINIAIKNTTKYLKLVLHILCKILIPLIIFMFATFYLMGSFAANLKSTNYLIFYKELLPLAFIIFIATLIILIYFILKYILSPYVYHENSNLSVIEIINKSNSIMKGLKGKYILLILSFIPWFLIAATITLIVNQFLPIGYTTPIAILLYTLIRPYIITSQLLFYEEIGDIIENTKKEA